MSFLSESTSFYVQGIVAGAAAAAGVNVAAIQAALNAGSAFIPPFLGDVYINQTLIIKSGGTLDVGTGTTIHLTGGAKNMLVNENWNTPLKSVLSVASADGKTATVVFAAAPNFALKSYFLLMGCVPDAYNGVWQVKTIGTTTVPNDTITFTLSSHLGVENPAITTPATVNPAYAAGTYFGTNTIVAAQADANITIRGGSWDYDVAANPGGAQPYYAFGMFLRRIQTLVIRDIVWKNCRNPIVPCNIYGDYLDNIDCYNCGSLIQHSGSCRAVKIGTVRGDAWDDHTTFLIGDWPGLADVTVGVLYGDMGVIEVASLLSENAYRFMKFAGQANFKFGPIKVGTIQGRTPLGAAAGFTVQDDAGFTNMAGVVGAVGTSGTSLVLERYLSNDPCGVRSIDIQNGQFDYMKFGLQTELANVAGAIGLAITNGANVSVVDVEINISANAYAGNAWGIYQDATIGKINILNGTFKNIGYGYIQGANATNNTVISSPSFVTINCGQGVVTKKNGTVINFAYAERDGYQSSPWLRLDGNTEVNIPTGKGLYATDAFGGAAGVKSLRNALGIGVDVGGAGVQRTAGAKTQHVTAVARGTLVNFNDVTCDATNAAGSWHQDTAPIANTY